MYLPSALRSGGAAAADVQLPLQLLRLLQHLGAQSAGGEVHVVEVLLGGRLREIT